MNVYVRELSQAMGASGYVVDVFTRRESADAPVTRSVFYACKVLAGNAACDQTGPSQTQITLAPHGWAILG